MVRSGISQVGTSLNWLSRLIDLQIGRQLEFHIGYPTHRLTATRLAPLASKAIRHSRVYETSHQRDQAITAGNRLWPIIALSSVYLAINSSTGWLKTTLDTACQQKPPVQAHMLALLPEEAEEHALTGEVLDARGSPVADAKVLLIYKSWPGNRYRQQAFETTTDDQGAFSFAQGNRPEGREAFLVTVVKEGYAFESSYVLKGDGMTVDPFVFQLTSADNKVFVFKESGRPSTGVSVALSRRKTAGSPEHLIYDMSASSVSFSTDRSGKVELNHFSIGDTIRLTVQSTAGSAVVEVTVDGNAEQEVEVQFKKPTAAAAALPWSPPAVTVEDSKIDWVRRNAVPIRAADKKIDDDDFADLQPLKKLIGDCRVVQLGEQSHGDGTCFQTKVRLIEFLHREMGFDVLAFESGLYDCDRANASFSQEMKPIEAAQQGVFGIWTGSSEVASLWDYIAATKKTSRPLELAGFDCQFTGQVSSTHLVKDLKALAEKHQVPGVADNTNRAWRQFLLRLQNMTSGEKFTGSKEKWMASLDTLIAAIESAKSDGDADKRELHFWRQQLRSLKAYTSYTIAESADSGVNLMEKQGNARDAQMAENLIWLANERYAGRKIIVWAASFHIMRNAAGIEVPDGSVNYSTIVPMGHHVHQKLGKEVYTIGFTALNGQAGTWFRQSFQISKAPSGTLEDICARAKLEQAILPLRDLPNEAAWLNEITAARPLGYSWMRARWSDHFDAMIFQRTMKPSTPIQ